MTLLEIQQGFGHALAAPATGPPWIASPDADERLDVYRGTVRTVLVKALSLNFPTVQRLVGAEFFEWAAALFAVDHQPVAASLDGYGEGVADFLHALPSCAALEYFPEVAQLDWAVSRTLHAEDAAPVEAAALSAIVDRAHTTAFVAHPAVSLLACRYPVDAFWSGVLGGEPDALGRVDLASGPCWLLVERDGLRPQSRLSRPSGLSRPEWEFAQNLFGGLSLADALWRAGDAADAPQWLAQHLEADRIVGWRITDNEENL
jgi:hypothetical protein